jgi:hypothetical protein
MIVTNQQLRLTHRVKIHQSSAAEVERMCSWCHQRIGKRFAVIDRVNFGVDGTWQCTWEGGDLSTYTFRFDHKQDAVVFALRWA